MIEKKLNLERDIIINYFVNYDYYYFRKSELKVS